MNFSKKTTVQKLRGCRYETIEEMEEGDQSFMCVLSIKCPYEKSLETYLMILVYIKRKKFRKVIKYM